MTGSIVVAKDGKMENSAIFMEARSFMALGKSADMQGAALTPNSEFGLYSKMIYTGIRFYC